MNDLSDRLAAGNPVEPAQVRDAAGTSAAADLLQDILCQSRSAPSRPQINGRGQNWRRPAWLATAAAVIIAATLAVQWLPGQQGGQRRSVRPDVKLVDFSVRHGNLIARITDPYAAGKQLTALFRARGLNIEVQVLPVSPSLVGTIVYTDAPIIRTLWKPDCGFTTCSIGLVIPLSFTGQAAIAVGRPARPGEHYESMADIFAPGEDLHCSGLRGVPASAALPVLRKLHVRVRWSEVPVSNFTTSSGDHPQVVPLSHKPTGYIADGLALSSRLIVLDTTPTVLRSPSYERLTAQLNRGCR